MKNQIKRGFELTKECAKEFAREEDGVGIVEVILILVILIGLVALFHEKIGAIVNKALSSIQEDANKINS